jgi:transcription initiation factor TFIIB
MDFSITDLLDVYNIDNINLDDIIFNNKKIINDEFITDPMNASRKILKSSIMRKNGQETNFCTDCKSDKIVEDYTAGIMTCTNCGNVLGNILDSNPEWRQYEEDGKADTGRCNKITNKLLPQSSLGLKMGGYPFGKLQRLQNWYSMPYHEKSLNDVFKMIVSVCDKAGIKKNIQDDAKIMYKSVSECKHIKGKNTGKNVITRGKNRMGIIASCVFLACRKNKESYLPKELADLFSIKHTELNRGCKNLIKYLKSREFKINTGTSKAEHFIIRYCNELHIKSELANEALKIAKNIEKINLVSEHTPFSIAATSVLIMAELNKIFSLTKKKIAKGFDISEVTISKTYKKIEKYKNILADDFEINRIQKNIENKRNNVITIPPEILENMKKFGIDTSEYVSSESENDYNKLNNNELIDKAKLLSINDFSKFKKINTVLNSRI